MAKTNDQNIESCCSKDQHTLDVEGMARRMALMYHFFTRTLKEELGRDDTERLLKRAIWRYGEYIGRQTKERAEEMGMEPSLENFAAASDLPTKGWDSETKTDTPEESRVVVQYCPFAEVWKDMGDPELSKLYCLVDPAKYKAYDARLHCEHVHNQLEGDDYCEIYVRKQKELG